MNDELRKRLVSRLQEIPEDAREVDPETLELIRQVLKDSVPRIFYELFPESQGTGYGTGYYSARSRDLFAQAVERLIQK